MSMKPAPAPKAVETAQEVVDISVVAEDGAAGKTLINPIVAKVGGLQSQGAKGEAVVNLLRIRGNAGSGVLRLSRRVNNMASN
jgi:hypothetical protein